MKHHTKHPKQLICSRVGRVANNKTRKASRQTTAECGVGQSRNELRRFKGKCQQFNENEEKTLRWHCQQRKKRAPVENKGVHIRRLMSLAVIIFEQRKTGKEESQFN